MQISVDTWTLNRVPWCKKGIGNVVQWEDRTNCTDQLPDQPLVCMVYMWPMLFTLILPFHMFAPPWSCSFPIFGSSQTSHNFLCNPEIWIYLYPAFYLINTARLLKYLKLIHHYFLSFSWHRTAHVPLCFQAQVIHVKRGPNMTAKLPRILKDWWQGMLLYAFMLLSWLLKTVRLRVLSGYRLGNCLLFCILKNYFFFPKSSIHKLLVSYTTQWGRIFKHIFFFFLSVFFDSTLSAFAVVIRWLDESNCF